MTNETQATQAATTTEGAESNTAPGETPTGGEQQEQQAARQQPQGQADAASTDPAQGAGADGEAGKPKPAEGAPEKYEFQAPEGTEAFDSQVLDAFSAVAKDLNLPQEQAQQILDKMTPVIQARQVEQLQAAHDQWIQAAETDKEFGGEKLQENMAVAKKALDTFGSPELRTLLNQSGLGNHPEIIRAFYRAGKAISEDRFIPSGQANAAAGANAKRLYPNSNMN
ncbi:protease [Castellaniella sp.]|uniref:protease n=1 Tax=Castellaniella sp. TaxID=1955812 RepID=UPI002AFFCFA9|nr:protease [Castellaniella sp.]